MTATTLERIAYNEADRLAGIWVNSTDKIAKAILAIKVSRLFALAGCPEYSNYWYSKSCR